MMTTHDFIVILLCEFDWDVRAIRLANRFVPVHVRRDVQRSWCEMRYGDNGFLTPEYVSNLDEQCVFFCTSGL